MRFLCESCGNNFETDKFSIRTYRMLSGVEKNIQASCPSCGKTVVSNGEVAYARATAPAPYNRPTKRLLGSDIKIVGFTKWQEAPGDLHELLEEERRLRALRESNDEAEEEEVPKERTECGSSGETVD
jgi:hypothetical protein